MMNVAIIYNTGQYYRLGIWRKLSSSTSNSFDIYCDMTNRDGIKQIPLDELRSSKNLDGLSLYPELRNVYLFGRLVYQFGIFEQMRTKNYDAIIVLGDVLNLSIWVLLLWAKLRGIKVLQWTHGLYGKEVFWLRNLRVFLAKCVDWTFTYGERAKGLLVDRGVDQDKVSVINNSLNEELLNSDYSKYQTFLSSAKRQTFVLVFVGRVSKRKRLDIALEAVALMRDKGYDVQLRIVGDGNMIEELKILRDRLLLQMYVHFEGALYDGAANKAIMESHLSVSPGHLGLFGIHSLSLGVPVVTHGSFEHQCPEVEVIKEGVTGSFYRKGDVHSFIEKIEYWMEQKDRAKTAENCRMVIHEKYNSTYQHKVINNALQNIFKD